jgi:hypothetical protein
MPTTTAETIRNAALTMTTSNVRVSAIMLVPPYGLLVYDRKVNRPAARGKCNSLLRRRRMPVAMR